MNKLIYMLTKTVKSIIAMLLCLTLINSCVSPFEARANARLESLRQALSTLPKVPTSELLGEEEGIVRSPVPICGTVHIMQLFGTNKLALQEIVAFYSTKLDPATWKVNSVNENGTTFSANSSIHLGISDNYRWVPSLQKVVEKGNAKFQTLFLVELVTFVNPNMTVDKCT